MTRKLPLKELSQNLLGSDYVLLGGLGFDQRCLEVLKNFPRERTVNIIGISNIGSAKFSQNNISAFRELAGPNSVVLGEDAKNIIEIADEVSMCINNILKVRSPKSLLVDITAMSHELLTVVLGILNSKDILNKITLLYVGASQYSFNTKDNEIWLSRGVKDIRSVLGFPGTMLPSRKLHLILLAGFEVERAAEVILRYEPTSLSIGKGARTQSISEKHHQDNKLFFDRLNEFLAQQSFYNEKINHFEFSCVDPVRTKNDLLKHINELPGSQERNIVICPLNTKISTVGAALVAIERPDIQLCYAEPMEYNADGYVKPDEQVSIIDLSDQAVANC